ncbi:hypothetical protein P3S67_023712 [Capsicum chacoense]
MFFKKLFFWKISGSELASEVESQAEVKIRIMGRVGSLFQSWVGVGIWISVLGLGSAFGSPVSDQFQNLY